MKKYQKPSLEIVAFTADNEIAAGGLLGTGSADKMGTEDVGGVPVTIFKINSFDSLS